MYTNISQDLKAWREQGGLTQVEAAELLLTPYNTYRGWENGRPAPPMIKTLIRVLKNEKN